MNSSFCSDKLVKQMFEHNLLLFYFLTDGNDFLNSFIVPLLLHHEYNAKSLLSDLLSVVVCL